MHEGNQYVEAGGLISYAANDADQYRRAAIFVDKILKGAKPADLPVEQPKKFEFVINLNREADRPHEPTQPNCIRGQPEYLSETHPHLVPPKTNISPPWARRLGEPRSPRARRSETGLREARLGAFKHGIKLNGQTLSS